MRKLSFRTCSGPFSKDAKKHLVEIQVSPSAAKFCADRYITVLCQSAIRRGNDFIVVAGEKFNFREV